MKIEWPTAVVASVACVSIAGTLVACVLTHQSAETIGAIVGPESVIAVLGLAMMRKLLGGKGKDAS